MSWRWACESLFLSGPARISLIAGLHTSLRELTYWLCGTDRRGTLTKRLARGAMQRRDHRLSIGSL